jgi:hypothetical protein
MSNRIGDWMQVGSGPFWPLDPRPEEIHIHDIAVALSNLCRFGGHVREFYSVAQHSVHVAALCGPEDALWGLLHDASEAYLGDIIRPLKRQECFAEYRAAEERLMAAICARFDLPREMPESVRRADEIMLATEARDLKNVDLETWTVRERPRDTRINPWSPARAWFEFGKSFEALTR